MLEDETTRLSVEALRRWGGMGLIRKYEGPLRLKSLSERRKNKPLKRIGYRNHTVSGKRGQGGKFNAKGALKTD